MSPGVVPAVAALATYLALPLGRTRRAFWPLEYELSAWAVEPGLHLVTPIAALLAIAFALLAPPGRMKGDVLIALSAIGVAATFWWLVANGVPFGLGALLPLMAFVGVAGAGLSHGGRIRADGFVTTSIVLVGLFISVFIVYPLALVLRTAVWADGAFSLEQVVRTLTGPLFLFVENPFTDVSETARVHAFMLVGAVLAPIVVAWRTRHAAQWRRWLLPVAWVAGGAVVGWLLGIMVYGRGAFASTVLVAAIAAPSATLLGFMMALLGQRTRFRPVRTVLNIVSVLPFITPPFVIAFSMIFLLGRRGLVSYEILGISPFANTLYGVFGVTLSQVFSLAPVAYLIIRGSLASLNPALEEAARTHGADRWTVFRTVTWPLVRPGLAASLLLSTIESISDFGTPLVLGGDRNFLATEVYLALVGRFNTSEASVYGSVLLALVLLVFVGNRLMLGRTAFTTVTGKPSGGAFVRLPLPLEAAMTTVVAVWFSFVLALYTVIFYGSFVRLWGIDGTLTLENYRAFGTQGWGVLAYTAQLALYSAVPAMLIGGLIAYLVVRQRFWGRTYVELGSLLSFATPGTVMGLAYVLAFNDGALLMTGTTIIIVLALVFRNMPVAIRASMAGLAQIDKSLEEASLTLNAGTGTTLVRVLMPLLTYPLLAGLIFAFVSAMTAVSQVIFLVGAGRNVATVLLLSWVERSLLGRAAAMASILIVSLLLLIVVMLVISRRVDARNTLPEGGLS